MADKFLNKTGLSRFWTRIKAYISTALTEIRSLADLHHEDTRLAVSLLINHSRQNAWSTEQLLDFLAYHELYFFPVILEQPQDITAAAGTTAYFPFRVGGDGLSYQWWYANPKTTGGEFRKSSATTDTYSIKASATSHSQGFFVYCVVTDRLGHTVRTRTASMTLA